MDMADSYVQDLGIKEDCVRIVKTAIEVLGGLDIVISNAVNHTLLHPYAQLSSAFFKTDIRAYRAGPNSPNSLIWMLWTKMTGTRYVPKRHIAQ